MSNKRYDAETYRVLCILLLIIIAFIVWGWHNSEQNRLKLLDELYEAKDRIEELERNEW